MGALQLTQLMQMVACFGHSVIKGAEAKPKTSEFYRTEFSLCEFYLAFDATPTCGFAKRASSNWGLITTFSMMAFSGGTGGS